MDNEEKRFCLWFTPRYTKQRNSRLALYSILFIFIFHRVSCNTVSIFSGFEKQTLEQGANFTLQCQATGLYHVTVTWLLDGLPLEYEKTKIAKSVQLKADNPHLGPSGLYDDRISRNTRYSIKTSNEFIDEVNKIDDVTIDDVNKDNTPESSVESISIIDKRPSVTNESTSLETVPSSNGLYSEMVPIVLSNIPISEDGIVSLTSELTLENASVQDGGIYTCVARDIIRETASWSRKIAVLGPLSIRQNRPIFALVDSVVILPCTVLGTGESFPVKWSYTKFTSVKIDLNSGDEFKSVSLPNDHRQTVHANGSFEIRDARKINEGTYTCQVDLGEKIANMSTPLKVMVPPKIKTFILPRVQVGKPLAEFCVVSEGDFPLDIFWYKNGVLLRPNDQVEMHRSGKRALSLSINGVSLDSAGNYSCCAQNNVSNTCHVSRLEVLDAPNILDLPLEVSAIAGNDVIIPCHATGFPKPNVTWMIVLDDSTNVPVPFVETQKIDLLIKQQGKVQQTKNGTLVIANVSSSHAGKYICQASNEVDELSQFVTLDVHNPARIIELNGTHDLIYGSDVIIKCASWGDDVIEIKWFKDDRPLHLAGRYKTSVIVNNWLIDSQHRVTLNELKIENSSRSDTGVYSCETINKYGTSTRSVNIHVRAPPPVPLKFEVIDKGTSFLQMILSPPEDDGGSKLLAYVLTFTKIFEESSPEPPQAGDLRIGQESKQRSQPATIRFPASATKENQKITLDKLQCGTEYEMKIRSENEIGESFQQLELTASTIGSAPMIPTVNELFVDVNQTAMVLDLRAWQNGGCPITELAIEYARHGDREWNVTVVDVDTIMLETVLSSSYFEDGHMDGKNPGHVIISNLQRGTWYKVWTFARNSAGGNQITHSVATLLSDGSTVPPINDDVDKKSAVESDDARFLVPMVCGFGLVLLLVLLFWFYRHKQRSKKQLRMKEARKMANTLLYKTEDNSYSAAPSVGGDRTISDQEEGVGRNNVDQIVLVRTCSENGSALLVTIDPVEDGSTSIFQYDQNMQSSSEPHSLLLNSSINEPLSNVENSNGNNSSSYNSKKSNGKKTLKDNKELAVFRDPETTDDDEAQSTYPLVVCDESAFGDSGTWAYYQPGSKSRRPRKYKPVPTIENLVPAPRRCSSSSTDEELAQVFGLTSSKIFKPVEDTPRTINSRSSDINDNYRPNSKERYVKNHHENANPNIAAQQDSKLVTRRSDQFCSVRDQQDRSHSAGLLQQREPRLGKALPEDLLTQSIRRQNFPTQHRQVPNRNPFKTAFRPPEHVPINLHRPIVHARGHTYTHDNREAGWPNSAPYNDKTTRYGTNALNSSPYGERPWVDTYDSQYGTARSKRPSWGSRELDKEGFYTPPFSNVSATKSDIQRNPPPKYRGSGSTPENQTDRIYPCIKDTNRKLDSNSPRDSGIGSDETTNSSNSRHLTSSISPPQMKARTVQKSLESLDEVESHKGNRSSSSCSSSNGRKNADKDFIFPMSPPPSPPSETKLTPHIFVDISSKCNTTPTRRPSRSSYPPCAQVPPTNYCQVIPSFKLGEYLPTPPPSGPTSPEEHNFSRSRKRQKNNGWCVADLDGLGKYQNKSDSQLAEHDRNTKQEKQDIPGINDAIYHKNNDENTWQTSTLV